MCLHIGYRYIGEILLSVQHCCQQHAKAPSHAPLHLWEWPGKPWARIHMDYAEHFMGKMFLVVVEAYSKWIDAYVVQTATTQVTAETLQVSFAVHGLPDVVVSDNGSCFTSSEFAQFGAARGIVHVTSSPYYHSSNGLAERAVQTLKQGLKKIDKGTIQEKLQTFLMSYRNTPHSTTEISPAELLFGRKPKVVLDLSRPNLTRKVLKKQEQKHYHDQRHSNRNLQVGQTGYLRNFATGPLWLPAVIAQVLGPLSYLCTLRNDRRVKRHVDHLRQRHSVSRRNNGDEAGSTPGEDDLPEQELTFPDLPSPEEEVIQDDDEAPNVDECLQTKVPQTEVP